MKASEIKKCVRLAKVMVEMHLREAVQFEKEGRPSMATAAFRRAEKHEERLHELELMLTPNQEVM